jgi:hypothetical protein
MHCVVQTNVPGAKPIICNGIDEARTTASNLCPDPGDSALIYEMKKVERVSTHQTTTFEEFMNASSN